MNETASIVDKIVDKPLGVNPASEGYEENPFGGVLAVEETKSEVRPTNVICVLI